MSLTATEWTEANQRYLAAAVTGVRAVVARHFSADGHHEAEPPDPQPALDPPAAIDRICAGFGLSDFERSVLLMCAGVELDSGFADLLTEAHRDTGSPFATFGLALAVLPGAHWSALSPGRPLRRWHLVDLAGPSPTASLLRIDERVLHVLTGVDSADGLGGLFEPVPAAGNMSGSDAETAESLARMWRDAPDVVPQLLGRATAKRAIAATATDLLGATLGVVDARLLPTDAIDLERLGRTVEREAVLSGTVVCVDADEADQTTPAALLVDRLDVPAVLCVRDPVQLRRRSTLGLDVVRAGRDEQLRLWGELRGTDQESRAVGEQFDLDLETIRSLARVSEPGELWGRCRAAARPRLGSLAQHIDPAAGWDDLVLPVSQLRTLHQIADQGRHRHTVYETWGLRRGRSRGLGTTALFAGPSGTGKTLAAEVLAGELRLDLYRVDLSAVVSKYIGETERNLRRVFDAADDGAAVLLFDEADALFGRRTEVKDSHDRYANIEVSYLLQRMEEYQGLAILTTNLQEALDPAFQRRIRFVVTFPFPDSVLREQIWRQAFGPLTPLEDFDSARLARLNLTGGSIRNIAVNAAFLAAADGRVVTMDHLLQAARDECAKLDQPWPVVV
jgi:hypothetical protein